MQRTGFDQHVVGGPRAWSHLVTIGLLVQLACPHAHADGVGSRQVSQSVMLGDRATQEAARSVIGSAIFAANWIAAPDVSDGADGLGPLYNATACSQCHPMQGAFGSGGGHQSLIGKVVRFDGGDGADTGDPRYGRQLQDRAVAGQVPEGRFELRWLVSSVTLSDGNAVQLRRPEVGVMELHSGPLGPHTRVSLRRSQPLAGIGLITAIAQEDIEAGADPDDRNGDGIRGRAGRAVDPATGKVGLARFGWKASQVTLAAQTANAFNLDMGLSSPLSPDPAGDCTPLQPACRSAPDGRSAAKAGYEVSAEELSLVVAYLEGLAPTRTADGNVNEAGRQHFEALGCGGCHRELFTTRDVEGAPHLSRKQVRLFSDLLLHDMGGELAVPGDAETPDGRSWRTAPLWGLGQRLEDIAAGHIDGLLHDGRARTIEEAILWHAGEGLAARNAYRKLSAGERDALLAYLADL